MGITVEKRIHYACDRAGCGKHNTAEALPPGWTPFHIPDNAHTGPSQQPALRALLCPECSTWLHSNVRFGRKPKQEAPDAT